MLAMVTALISGVAVFVNGYGVRAWRDVADAATYTTTKNLVAALILTMLALAGRRPRLPDVTRRPHTRRHWLLLGAIAVVGGSVPFVLFFEGLARATSTQAGFIHKTLVVWVTVMAIVFLRERVGPLHIAAVVLLVWGQATLAGGVGTITPGTGEMMMLAATLLWSVEVILAKRLLADLDGSSIAVARMLGGGLLLLGFVAASGRLSLFAGLSVHHIGWVLLTGFVLSLYVATWYAALARAPAVDVTAVLVAGAIVTAGLETGIRGADLATPTAMAALAVGAAIVIATTLRRTEAPS